MNAREISTSDTDVVSEGLGMQLSSPLEVIESLRAEPLLQLCQRMKDLLCDGAKVEPAMRTLAHACIGRENPLQASEVQVIISFYSDKASTRQLAKTSLECLLMLIEDLTSATECDIQLFQCAMQSLFSKIELQKFPVAPRKAGFQILGKVLNKFTLGASGSQDLRTLLDTMDGEGEPVLVRETFRLCREILDNAPSEVVKEVSQDFFELLASYFPVVFSQPPGCPVSKKMLQEDLGLCLVHHSLSEYCVPFLLGKLASPSILVKQEVLETLLECITSYSLDHVEGHIAAIVTHMRNEVLKMSAYPDYQNNASIVRCISTACRSLSQVSAKLSHKASADVLQFLDPIMEGALSSLTSERSVSSAYATMLYGVLSASWNVCVVCGGYAFAMMLISVPDDNLHPSALMLLTSVLAGMRAGISLQAAPENNAAAAMGLRDRIQKVSQSFLDFTTRVSNSVFSATSSTDDFLWMCVADYLIAAISLAHDLQYSLDHVNTQHALSAIIHMATAGTFSSAVSQKSVSLIAEYAAVDPEQFAASVSAMIALPDEGGIIDVKKGLAFLEIASSTSEESRLFVLVTCLISGQEPSSSWLARVPVADKAGSFASVIQGLDSLEDDIAKGLLQKLTSTDKAEYFECICAIFIRSSAELRKDFESSIATLDIVTLAAFVCTCPESLIASPQNLYTQFSEQVNQCGDGCKKCCAALNGITGIVCMCSSKGEEAVSSQTLIAPECLIAFLWGKCLLAADDEEEEQRMTGLLSDFIINRSGDGEAALMASLSFFPFQEALYPQRGSLLSLYLKIGDESILSRSAYWAGLKALIGKENAHFLQESESLVLSRLLAGRQCLGAASDTMLEVLTLVMESSPRGSLELALVKSADLTAIVLQGLSAEAFSTRCKSLHLLTRAAAAAQEQMAAKRDDPVHRDAYAQVREKILSATISCLSDKKRKVRQGAAWCRHAWYKVK